MHSAVQKGDAAAVFGCRSDYLLSNFNFLELHFAFAQACVFGVTSEISEYFLSIYVKTACQAVVDSSFSSTLKTSYSSFGFSFSFVDKNFSMSKELRLSKSERYL